MEKEYLNYLKFLEYNAKAKVIIDGEKTNLYTIIEEACLQLEENSSEAIKKIKQFLCEMKKIDSIGNLRTALLNFSKVIFKKDGITQPKENKQCIQMLETLNYIDKDEEETLEELIEIRNPLQ